MGHLCQKHTQTNNLCPQLYNDVFSRWNDIFGYRKMPQKQEFSMILLNKLASYWLLYRCYANEAPDYPQQQQQNITAECK